MALPLSHLQLLAPPLRLLLGAMWRIARQQAYEHYGMIEEFIVMATEAVPDLLSIKEKTILLSALRTKMFLSDPNPCRLGWTKVSTVTYGEWQRSMSCLMDAVSKGLDPQTLREVFGREFDAALEALLRHFLSRLQQRLPVPDFTKVSDLLQDNWLKDCLQEVNTQELKELLTNHSTAHKATRPDGELMSEVVLKSAWQQLLHIQKIKESEPTNPKQEKIKTTNEKQHLPRVTNQRPAAANQAPVVTLLKLLPNQTTLFLIPTNQSSVPILQTNQSSAPVLQTNQSSAPVLQTNQSSAPVLQTNQSSAPVLQTNQSSAPILQTNQSSAPVLQTNQDSTPVPRTNEQRRASKRKTSKCTVANSTNQELPSGPVKVSDQLEPSSCAVTDQSETANTEALPTEAPRQDSVSQNSQRLAQEETHLKEKTPEETHLKEKTPEETHLKEKTPEETHLRRHLETHLKEKTPEETHLKEKTPEETHLKEKTPEETHLKETPGDTPEGENT